ncbi:MAG TPA: TolC family protein [Pedobacter sp.]|uniref:TolC family protein n=1 Tax=Pedobacter sp. TaxID=1411316 RepID=UPI002BC23E61|nr:TolC family protein [Pedobacter sp.]HMI01454.1 TolC family protein [Pedobacter sp.]
MYTSFIKILSFVTAWVILTGGMASAQQQDPRLDVYISDAFSNNQGLKQQKFDLDRAMFALREAKSMYLPSVSMLGSYTKASGGRTIDVPVGDLINPIYTALNELTSSSKFPQLSNTSEQLNPDNFYDVKLRTSLPLINAEIRYNKLIKQQLISIQQASVNVYKRALVKDIKTAYYQYYQSLQGVEAYKSALLLINENIRVNASLLKNGVRNGTALLRAQTEQQKINAALISAQKNTENARAYFNFLLNRPLGDSIDTSGIHPIVFTSEPDSIRGVDNREELKQLKATQQVNSLDYKLQRSAIIPKLNTFLDLGSQGTGTTFNGNTRYYLWGVNLQWDLFTGGKNKYRAAQSQASLNATAAKLEETEDALKLTLLQSLNNYRSVKAADKSARAALTFAEKYFRDQLKAYQAGQLLYLELLDAQDQLISTKLRIAETQADLQISIAELERNQATYPIDNSN